MEEILCCEHCGIKMSDGRNIVFDIEGVKSLCDKCYERWLKDSD